MPTCMQFACAFAAYALGLQLAVQMSPGPSARHTKLARSAGKALCDSQPTARYTFSAYSGCLQAGPEKFSEKTDGAAVCTAIAIAIQSIPYMGGSLEDGESACCACRVCEAHYR